jgi:hypothetical protein
MGSDLDLAKNEKDITIINESYKITNFVEKDLYEKSIESKLSLLKSIKLALFANYLRKFNENKKGNFSINNVDYTKQNIDFSKSPFNQVNFVNFIDNLINELVLKKKKNSKEIEDFKKFLIDLFISLESYFKIFVKNNNEGLTKLHILSFGLLFCEARSIEKIKLFFDILSNNNKLKYNRECKEFLFCLFSLSSYVLFEVSKNHGYITEEEELNLREESYLNYTSVITLLLKFKKKVLNDNNELEYKDFVQLFNQDDISKINWPFDITGILILLINYCNIKDKIYNYCN